VGVAPLYHHLGPCPLAPHLVVPSPRAVPPVPSLRTARVETDGQMDGRHRLLYLPAKAVGTTTTTHINGLFSGTSCVNGHQKGILDLNEPMDDGVAVASAGHHMQIICVHLAADRQPRQYLTTHSSNEVINKKLQRVDDGPS